MDEQGAKKCHMLLLPYISTAPPLSTVNCGLVGSSGTVKAPDTNIAKAATAEIIASIILTRRDEGFRHFFGGGD